MTDEEVAALAAWLRRTQGVALDPAPLRESAATAVKLSALAGRAAANLAFGAEPSGFDFATANLKRPDGRQEGGGDAG